MKTTSKQVKDDVVIVVENVNGKTEIIEIPIQDKSLIIMAEKSSENES